MRPMQPGCLDQGCIENNTASQKSRMVGNALGCVSMACLLSESVVISHSNVESHFGRILEMYDALLLMPAVLMSVRDL